MSDYEKERITKKRNYLVVKSNDLIQKSRFELSLPEQKTIAYICSMIVPAESSAIPYQLEYEFNIRDYCKILGIDYNNGNNYIDVKENLKKLRDKSMWLKLPDGSETLVGWLAKVTTNKRSGIAKIRLDEDLVPYLFELKENFTKYELVNILAMKSAFSVRMYELLKSHEFKKTITFDTEELKLLLKLENVKSYEQFSPFRQKVLEVAEREINQFTDINISYEYIKQGKRVVKIKVKISRKNAIDLLIATEEVNNKIDCYENTKKSNG